VTRLWTGQLRKECKLLEEARGPSPISRDRLWRPSTLLSEGCLHVLTQRQSDQGSRVDSTAYLHLVLTLRRNEATLSFPTQFNGAVL
jgi:hypothetical protein